jgi:hypothetical protein
MKSRQGIDLRIEACTITGDGLQRDQLGRGRRFSEVSATTRVGPLPLFGDAEIRGELLQRLRARHAKENDVAFVEELGLCRGQVFVDVAVVNGSIHGYEIKSDRDSLRRLASQVAMYGRVLDRATLVVGEKHADEAALAVPAWWEIQMAKQRATELRLKRLRTGRRNPAREARALVELLWLDDALALLNARGGLRGYRGRPRREVWDRVCELYSVDEIAATVRKQLKARSARRSAQSRK